LLSGYHRGTIQMASAHCEYLLPGIRRKA